MKLTLYRIAPKESACLDILRLMLIDLFPEGYVERVIGGKIFFDVYDTGERVSGLKSHPCVSDVSRYDVDSGWEYRWMEDIRPTFVGRVVVWPTWSKYAPKNTQGMKVVRLSEGMAFGTGEHPTTYSVLRLMQFLDFRGLEVLDVGTGSGVLSIAAAMLGAENVLGIDVDEIAVDVARQNALNNGVQNRVEFMVVDIFKFNVDKMWDVVLANLVWSLLSEIPGILRSLVKPGGWLIVGGLLEEQVDAFVALYSGFDFVPLLYCLKDGWAGVLLHG